MPICTHLAHCSHQSSQHVVAPVCIVNSCQFVPVLTFIRGKSLSFLTSMECLSGLYVIFSQIYSQYHYFINYLISLLRAFQTYFQWEDWGGPDKDQKFGLCHAFTVSCLATHHCQIHCHLTLSLALGTGQFSSLQSWAQFLLSFLVHSPSLRLSSSCQY